MKYKSGRNSVLQRSVGWVNENRCEIEDAAHLVMSIVLFPFKVIAVLWRAFETAGRWIILGAIRFLLGLFGLVFIGFVAFGLIRALLHPLFQ